MCSREVSFNREVHCSNYVPHCLQKLILQPLYLPMTYSLAIKIPELSWKNPVTWLFNRKKMFVIKKMFKGTVCQKYCKAKECFFWLAWNADFSAAIVFLYLRHLTQSKTNKLRPMILYWQLDKFLWSVVSDGVDSQIWNFSADIFFERRWYAARVL